MTLEQRGTCCGTVLTVGGLTAHSALYVSGVYPTCDPTGTGTGTGLMVEITPSLEAPITPDAPNSCYHHDKTRWLWLCDR